MSIPDNDLGRDSGILQMGLVVSDAEAEGNGIFNEELDSDHDGSEPPPLMQQERYSTKCRWASMTQYLSSLVATCPT